MFFSNTHRPQLTAPFYSILFETCICQFNSSVFSPIMPDEVTEHLTRDQRPFLHPESLQILQIHPESLQILQIHPEPLQILQIHPESLQILQIHPEPLQILQIHPESLQILQIHPESLQILQIHPESLQILQIHSFFSSVHRTHFLQGSGQRTGMTSRSLVFCVVFEVCVWIIVRLEDPNMAHYKISESVTYWFFICWYLIESMMPCV